MRIARALEALQPDPPLFPRDDLEGAEAWADSALQDGVRQLARYGVGQGPGGDGELPRRPAARHPGAHRAQADVPVIRPVVALQMRRPKTGTAETCLRGAARPARPRRRAARAEGVIGGERPNAVDFQVAPSVRLMLNFDQLREHIDARPAGAHARALVPDYPGPVPGSVPGTVASVLRQDITLAGEVAAWLWHPEGATGCVVLGHGLCAVRDQRLPRLRRALRRGRASPRCCSTTATSARAAASRASCSTSSASSRTGAPRSPTRAGCDGVEQVGLFGSSFGGGHAIDDRRRVDPRVAAAVAQCPMTDGLKAALQDAEVRPRCKLGKLALQDELGSRLGRKPKLHPGRGQARRASRS